MNATKVLLTMDCEPTTATSHHALSADFSKILDGPARHNLCADLRSDVDWPVKYGVIYRTVATNIVGQVSQRPTATPTLCAITRNHYDYRKTSDPIIDGCV